MNIRQEIKEVSKNLGFDFMGFSDSHISEKVKKYFNDWIQKGYHDEMKYMENISTRLEITSKAKTIIIVGTNYLPLNIAEINTKFSGEEGRVALFALGEDYHNVMRRRLKKLKEFIRKIMGEKVFLFDFVDSSPILEKYFAAKAGLGFIGKNTLLINECVGSFCVLGGILIDSYIDLDQENFNTNINLKSKNCGECELCIKSCPTHALIKPYELDARRCISWITQNKKIKANDERLEAIQNWLFGCDICQLVCPYNKITQQTSILEFKSRYKLHDRIALTEILEISDQDKFKEIFKGSQLYDLSLEILLRNARAISGEKTQTRLHF